MDDNKLELLSDGYSEEEMEEILSEFDETVVQLFKNIEPREGTSVLNIERLKEFMFAYEVLKSFQGDGGCKVSYNLSEVSHGRGVITIMGKNVVLNNPKRFVKAAELASNFNAYPRTDGTIRLDFMFYGLTNRIE